MTQLSSDTWSFGRDIDAATSPGTGTVYAGTYNGGMDDVRIYDRALTPDEIHDIATHLDD